MADSCAVPGCNNRYDRETHISYHRVSQKNKKVFNKELIYKIRRPNLATVKRVNTSMQRAFCFVFTNKILIIYHLLRSILFVVIIIIIISTNCKVA